MRGIYLIKHSHVRCLKLSHLVTGHLPGQQFSLSYLQKSWLTLRCLKWHWSALTGQLNAVSALCIHVLHGCQSAAAYSRLGMNLPKHFLLLFCLCKEMSFDKRGADLLEQKVKCLLGMWEIVGFEFLVWIRQAGFEPGSSTSSGSALIIRPSANHSPWVNSCQILIIWKQCTSAEKLWFLKKWHF